VLVEQSVPLALEVAERAYFLEKGQVRFEGPTRELLDRPDLIRAVLLDPGATGHGAAGLDAGAADRDAPAAFRHASVRQADANVPRTRSGGGPVRLEVRDVSKRFGGVVALYHVSFTVHDGEILGILGP